MASLGDLYFALGLDDKQFNNAIEAAKKKVQELGANVNVSVNIDTAKALQQLQSVLKTDNSVKINADISQLTANIKQAERELQELKEKSSWNTSAISSKQGFIQNQQAQLAELQQRLKAIEALSPTINLKVSVPSSEYTKVINEVKTTLSNKAGIDVAVTPKINKTNVKEALKTALDGVEMKVNVKPAILKKGLKKLEVEANKTTLSNSITNALKNKTFKARVDLVVGKAQVQDAIRAAFQQAGLQYNTTASDVRTARIREIDSRTRSRELLDQERLNRLRNQGYNEAIRNSERLGSSVRNVNSWASQLGEQINNAFSIYALQNFVKNLITIGGEFEKQHIALQAMIGDAKLADSLFERTKDLSIKSPFTFSELTRYIKQMSAYGVEYEELYDTTKRLADISAGVGVDMNRLILAYGQVRSAEVLRGQELRQFTEAGIPLVAELARKFNELGDAGVKAGDVFEKISQKAVPFSMVRDVLFEMTDPGGRFFKMQERQAESLAGRYSNLKDAWDIMIADMSKDQHNVLSTLLDITASLIRNWEKVIPVLAAVTTAIGLYNSALTITNLLQNSLLSNPFSAALAIIGGIAAGVYLWSSTLDDVYDKIEKINSKTEKEVQATKDKAKNAERYLDALSKVSEKESLTAEEARRKKELTDALVQMYPSLEDSLKKQKLTLEDIKKLKGEIVGLTAEETEKALLNAKTSAKALYDEAKANQTRKETGKKTLGGGVTVSYVDYSQEEKNEAAKLTEFALANFLEAERKYQEFIDNRDSFLKKIEDDRKSGWVQKALDAIAKNASFNIVKPKDNQTLDEYLDYLIEEASEAEKKIEKYADKTERKKYSDRMKAFNAVITAVGGRRVSKQGNEDIKKQAENDIKAYVEGLKDAVDKIGKKWDLYKQLFDLTGDKNFAMTAFDNTQIWDEAALEMRKKFEESLSLSGIQGEAEFNISNNVAKAFYGDLYDAWKEIKDRIEKNGIDLKVNAANAIKDSKSIEDQIKAIENKRDAELENYTKGTSEYDAVAEKWNKQIQELRKNLWELSPEFKKLFVDTTGMSVNQIENLREEAQRILAIIQNGTPNNKTGMVDFEVDGNVYSTKQEAITELIEWINKLGKKTSEVKDSFNRLWDWINGEEQADGTKLQFKDIAKDLSLLAQQAADTAQSISSMFDALGDEGTADAFALGGNILSGVSSIGQGLASGNPFAVLSGVTGIIGSIAQHHDKKLDRAIKKSQLEVLKLTNAYKQLETTIERQLGSVTSKQSKEMLENLKSQKSELQKQYELEDEKKKTDKSKLEDYKNQIAELEDQIKYFYEDLASEQYGVDIKGWSSQIAEALTEAFATGEDAAKAFNNTVADILRKLATEAIKLQFIEPAMNSLREYMFGDNGIFTDNSSMGTDLSSSELAGLKTELDKLKGQIDASNDYWDKINDAVGGILDSTEKAESGGLTKEIQGVTEDTANLLGSYINSIRHDVSVKRSIIEKLAGEDIPKMSLIAQAQLTQLNNIASNTLRNAEAADKIYDLFNRVVDKGGNKLKI